MTRRPVCAGVTWVTAGALFVGSTAAVGGAGTACSTEDACDAFFDTYVAMQACTELPLAPSDLDRIRPRFDAVCAAKRALPGSGLTSAYFVACTQAYAGLSCSDALPTVCAGPVGSLGAGLGCAANEQCRSGNCVRGGGLPSDGDAGAASNGCGTCSTAAGVGDPCNDDACDYDQTCIPEDPNANVVDCLPGTTCQYPDATCAVVTYGGVGATCDQQIALCGTGLVCGQRTSTCESPGAEGAPCATLGDCASGLYCASSACDAGSCAGGTCQPALPIGSACVPELPWVDEVATPGACGSRGACDPTTSACAALRWADPGSACGWGVLCRVGRCPVNEQLGVPDGMCPAIIADGQPCSDDPTDGTTCDTFSLCASGVCTLEATQRCN